MPTAKSATISPAKRRTPRHAELAADLAETRKRLAVALIALRRINSIAHSPSSDDEERCRKIGEISSHAAHAVGAAGGSMGRAWYAAFEARRWRQQIEQNQAWVFDCRRSGNEALAASFERGIELYSSFVAKYSSRRQAARAELER